MTCEHVIRCRKGSYPKFLDEKNVFLAPFNQFVLASVVGG